MSAAPDHNRHTDMNIEVLTNHILPGKPLTGKLSVKVNYSTKFVNLRVELVAIERTQVEKIIPVSTWGAGAIGATSHTDEDYWYFRHVVTVDGNTLCSKDRTPITLEEGLRCYDFGLNLPCDLPPTFRGDDAEGTKTDDTRAFELHHGSVRMMYLLVAIIEFADGSYEALKKEVTVHPEPINQQQHDASPHGIEMQDRIHVHRFAFMEGGHVKLHAKIPRTMLAAGVDNFEVPLDVDLKDCKGSLKTARVNLRRRTHVLAGRDEDDEFLLIAQGPLVAHPIASGAKGTIPLSLTIPKGLTPSVHLVGTQIRYEVEVDLAMSGCEDIAYRIPVTIAPAEIDPSNSSRHFEPNAVHVCRQSKKKFVETVCYHRLPSRSSSFASFDEKALAAATAAEAQ